MKRPVTRVSPDHFRHAPACAGGAILAAGTGVRAGLWRHDAITGRSAAAALLVWGLAASTALANPQDGVISGGAGNIANSGNRTDITQSTDRMVIDWRSFNIAPE